MLKLKSYLTGMVLLVGALLLATLGVLVTSLYWVNPKTLEKDLIEVFFWQGVIALPVAVLYWRYIKTVLVSGLVSTLADAHFAIPGQSNGVFYRKVRAAFLILTIVCWLFAIDLRFSVGTNSVLLPTVLLIEATLGFASFMLYFGEIGNWLRLKIKDANHSLTDAGKILAPFGWGTVVPLLLLVVVAAAGYGAVAILFFPAEVVHVLSLFAIAGMGYYILYITGIQETIDWYSKRITSK